MLKVFFLIFEPNVAWEKIARARRGFLYIVVIQLMPLLLLSSALEGWGLINHGKWQPQFQNINTFPRQDIIAFEIIEFCVLLAVVFISAILVHKISQTFQERLTFLQAFTTVAYGLSPMLLIHCLDASAMMNPLLPWLIGIFLAIWIFYQGIPRVMQPDPTHAFGIYLSTVFVVVLTTGTARVITGMYLLGFMDFQHSWLLRRMSHLFGH